MLFAAAGVASAVVCDQNVTITSSTLEVRVAWEKGEFIWLDSLRFMTAYGNWSANILNERATAGLVSARDLSNTAFVIPGPDNQIYAARLDLHQECPTVSLSDDGRSVNISGILLGPFATPMANEQWELSVSDAGVLRWGVTRHWVRDARVLRDRFPALVMPTLFDLPNPDQYGPWHFIYQRQVPSVPSAAMVTNPDTGGGFQFGSVAPWTGYYSYPMGQATTTVKLSPSGVAVVATAALGGTIFAKEATDGTSPLVWVGAGTVNAAATKPGGSVEAQVWTLQFDIPSQPLAVLQPLSDFLFDHPGDPAVEALARSFADVHNQWAGYVFGNNPASSPCLHEMAYFGYIQLIYGPGNAPSADVLMPAQLDLFLTKGVNADSGFVMPRYQSGGFYMVMWGPLHDQVPHAILCAYAYILRTADTAAFRRWAPALRGAADYLLSSQVDGVFVPPGDGGVAASGRADGGRHATNWYDVINFGFKDAIVNVYAVAAFSAMAELEAWGGDPARAATYAAAAAAAKEAYNEQFWDEESGYYADWIDVDGVSRRYLYADSNLLAVVYGIASPARAKRIIAAVDAGYARIARKFGIDRWRDMYATPSNFVGLSDIGEYCAGAAPGGSSPPPFPAYENGIGFFHTTGAEILARAVAGNASAAYAVLRNVLHRGYERYRLWGQNYDWQPGGGPYGGDYLNSALLIMWGGLLGGFGVQMNLTSLSLGAASPQLEGARWRFKWMGQAVCVTVKNGAPIRC